MDCSPPGSSLRGFSQAEHWRGLPFPSPGDLSDAGVKPVSAALASGFLTTEPPGSPNWEHLTVFVNLLKITAVNPLHINLNSTFTESSYIFLLRNNLVRRETLLYISETLTSGSRGNS